MKKFLFILCLSLSYHFCGAQTQSLPYISSPTIIPQSPTSSDIIKIVTKVTTPNQGIIVDQGSFTVIQSPKEINIRGCYWHGMLTAIQEYVDTFVIGQLPAGTYAIKHKAYLSSTQQHCSATDSNLVVTSLTVSGAPVITGLARAQKENSVFIFPNPVKDVLYFKNSSEYLTAEVYSYNGSIIKTERLGARSEITLGDLPDGLYFVRFSGANKTETVKLLKSNFE